MKRFLALFACLFFLSQPCNAKELKATITKNVFKNGVYSFNILPIMAYTQDGKEITNISGSAEIKFEILNDCYCHLYTYDDNFGLVQNEKTCYPLMKHDKEKYRVQMLDEFKKPMVIYLRKDLSQIILIQHNKTEPLLEVWYGNKKQ